jgi:hypothetical protein
MTATASAMHPRGKNLHSRGMRRQGGRGWCGGGNRHEEACGWRTVLVLGACSAAVTLTLALVSQEFVHGMPLDRVQEQIRREHVVDADRRSGEGGGGSEAPARQESRAATKPPPQLGARLHHYPGGSEALRNSRLLPSLVRAKLLGTFAACAAPGGGGRSAAWVHLAQESLRFDASGENVAISYISGAWNIGRKSHRTVSLRAGEAYKFENDYIERLNSLLAWGAPTEVVVEPRYRDSVRLKSASVQRVRELSVEELRSSFQYYDDIQRIRKDPAWLRQAGWLPDSPQADTDMYNVVVMSKLYLLADFCLRNPFSTQYFVWLDAGVCTASMIGPRNLKRLEERMRAYMRSDRLWICHAPYPGGPEVHGFRRSELHRLAGRPVELVPKGGMFGGTCPAILRALVAYDEALHTTLPAGLMGTEETVFALLHATHPHLFEACANEVEAHPGQETMCQFLDDNYHGFGEPNQLHIRASAQDLQSMSYQRRRSGGS